MFVVVNSFKVKPEKSAKFEEAWHDFTEQLYVHSGSLGARLHKTEQGDYIGYEQWPKKEIWEEALDKIPPKSRYVLENLSSCYVKTETTLKLNLTADLLMPRAFSF